MAERRSVWQGHQSKLRHSRQAGHLCSLSAAGADSRKGPAGRRNCLALAWPGPT